MSDAFSITIDGTEVPARVGQTVIEAADAAGLYIPRLCYLPGLEPAGACRVCTVLVHGRPQAACIQPVVRGMVVVSDTAELRAWRKGVVEMLLVEGNHFCMACERSGACELQATAYRLGVTAPRHPYLHKRRGLDASHPDVLVDFNRCIRCGRCVRASQQVDRKSVFGFVGRGAATALAFDGPALAATDLSADDRAASVCPVGCILRKRVGFAVPVGERPYDRRPIGSDVEARRGRGGAR